MIERRQTYKPGLPYDAEVDYLICDGNQYIDTGLAEDLLEIDIKVNPTVSAIPYSKDMGLWGYDASTTQTYGNMRYLAIKGGASQGKLVIRLGATNQSHDMSSSTLADGSTSTLLFNRLDTGNNQIHLYVNNIANDWCYATGRNSSTNYQNYYLCGVNGTGTNSFVNLIGNFYSATIANPLTGITLKRYISVRIGTVGYIYDKINKQLYPSIGSSDFVPGPDKRR